MAALGAAEGVRMVRTVRLDHAVPGKLSEVAPAKVCTTGREDREVGEDRDLREVREVRDLGSGVHHKEGVRMVRIVRLVTMNQAERETKSMLM